MRFAVSSMKLRKLISLVRKIRTFFFFLMHKTFFISTGAFAE